MKQKFQHNKEETNRYQSIIILTKKILIPRTNNIDHFFNVRSKFPSSISNGGKFNSGRKERERERKKTNLSADREKIPDRNREEENETRISRFIQLRRLKTRPFEVVPACPTLPSLISLYRCSFSKQNYTPPRCVI